MLRTLALVTLVVALAAPIPASAQVIDSVLRVAPFNAFTFYFNQHVEWAGIGGPAGVNDPNAGLTNPTPDDCLDADDRSQNLFGAIHYYVPSIGQRTVHQEHETILPGSSVPAPAELVALCTVLRENLNGQPSGHTYASDPQSIGVGDVDSQGTSFALPWMEFSEEYAAHPPSLSALVCTMDLDSYAGTESQGDEDFAGLGFPNGILFAQADACLDVRDDILSYLTDENPNEPGEWDAGTVNTEAATATTVILWDLDLYTYDRQFGLHALCFKATVFDLNNAVAGVVEDYGYFWVDGPENAYQLAPLWAPVEASDGEAYSQDCSSIGIPL